ncbi:MAG: endonuclease III [Candidatus Levybacteria bacterium]|nr:endonuclease III [Candidatus Levybacteria bacterium]
MTLEEKVLEVNKRLTKDNPHPKIALDFTNPMELLVATIMSAQTTDKLVNLLTPALFKKYPTVKDYAEANVEDIQTLISKVNFSGNKAKNIKASAQIIVDKHEGNVPDNMEDLDALPGVARKTANVVLGQAFHKAEGIVIDTHMIRMSNKLGFTTQKDPVKIEKDLMAIVPKELWIEFPARLILHGRHFCTARPHDCTGCPLGDLCPDK